MIHPMLLREGPGPRRAALYLGPGPQDGSVIASAGGTKWLADRAALLEELTSDRRGYGQAWLTPGSPLDWGWCLEPLARAGWSLGASSRQGRCHSLYVYKPGRVVRGDGATDAGEDDDATGEEDQAEDGAVFAGRDAGGYLDPVPGLTGRAAAEDTYARLCLIDEAVRAAWPGVGLASTPALTGGAVFASLLAEEIGCAPEEEVTLRRAGAYGGGRIQMLAEQGVVVARAAIHDVPPTDDDAYEDEATLADGPYDVDLMAAYPTALMVPGATGAEYVDEGDPRSDEYRAPCAISYAAVEVPRLPYGPLRVLDEDDQPSYPVDATVMGAWTSDELRAAEACGCRVLAVQHVWRFAPRAEFVKFGTAMKAWRASLPEGHPARPLAKAMAVGTVGAWGMRPSRTRRYIGPFSAMPEEQQATARARGPYDWDVVVPTRQHRRALLPAACFVTGRVRAWSALALHGLALTGADPLYWHTDGGATRRHPGPGLRWAAAHGGPPLAAWRRRPLRRIQVWSPGSRHEVMMDGSERRVG